MFHSDRREDHVLGRKATTNRSKWETWGALLIDLHRAANSWETLDSRSEELEALYRHVFGRYAGVMRPAVAKIYDNDTDMFFDRVLYIEKVEVDVEHRGRGVGL